MVRADKKNCKCAKSTADWVCDSRIAFGQRLKSKKCPSHFLFQESPNEKNRDIWRYFCPVLWKTEKNFISFLVPRLFIHLPKHRLSFFLTKNIHALVTSQASEWHSFNIHWTLSLLEYFYDSPTGLGSNPGPDIMLLNETVNGLSFTHYDACRS